MNGEQLAASGELARSIDASGLEALSTFAPGLYPDVSEAQYHQKELGVGSKSALDQVHKSGLHYHCWLTAEEREPTPAMAFGKLTHTAVLEPHKLRAPAGKKGAQDHVTALAIADAVRAHPLAGKMIQSGSHEVTLRWDDPDSGIPCKARLDGYDPSLGLVYDLKTCSDASPREFARSVANYRYFVQAAMYLAGLDALGLPADHFVFISVEKVEPFAVAVYSLDAYALDAGLRAMRRDLRTLADCCASGLFPSYPDKIITLELPPWAGE